MLKRRIVNKLAWTVLAFVSMIPGALGQTDVVPTVSSAQRVVDALAIVGIAAGPEQIDFLSGIRGTGERPRVRVASVTDSLAGTVKVKLRCEANHGCLPFYVLVHGLRSVNAIDSETHTATPSAESALPMVIRGGDHATLILESPDSRMRFPVICLQSGVRGQRVRVASPDHKRFYEAEVVAPGMLKGSF